MKIRALVASVALVATAAAGLWWALRPAHAPQGEADAAEIRNPQTGEPERRPPARARLSPIAEPAPIEAPSAPPPIAVQGQMLVAHLAALLARQGRLSADERTTRADLEARILDLGEAAAPALVERFDRDGDGVAARERLFNVLRQVPGPTAEARLALEARAGTHDTLRTMAIESLAQRKTPQALDTLAAVAETDSNLPAHPLIAQPRSPDDTGTEVPDEQVFTPRMQAMAALASTDDPRAGGVLADIVRSGPDESLRMEAARDLKALRDDGRATEALREAATTDPSAYVRLAALHAMQGSSDPGLPALLQRIASHDDDAGVRILARQILDGVGR